MTLQSWIVLFLCTFHRRRGWDVSFFFFSRGVYCSESKRQDISVIFSPRREEEARRVNRGRLVKSDGRIWNSQTVPDCPARGKRPPRLRRFSATVSPLVRWYAVVNEQARITLGKLESERSSRFLEKRRWKLLETDCLFLSFRFGV